MFLRLTFVFMFTLATVFAAPKVDDAKCKDLAQKIEENFKGVKAFQGFLNYSAVFPFSIHDIGGNYIQYNIEVKNSRITGVDHTTTETVKECQTAGNRSLSMKVHLNIGNPRIISDVYYKNTNYYTNSPNKNTEKIEVASYAFTDIVYEAQILYNEDWKRIAVMYITQVNTAQFVSDSDCGNTIQFCNALHSKLNELAWNQTYIRIPYILRQILFRMEL